MDEEIRQRIILDLPSKPCAVRIAWEYAPNAESIILKMTNVPATPTIMMNL